MPRPPQPLLPLKELMVSSGLDRVSSPAQHLRDGRWDKSQWTYLHAAPMQALAEHAGRDRRTCHRWAKEGLPLSIAEDLCDILGLHPVEVWGDAWIMAVLAADPEEEAAWTRASCVKRRNSRKLTLPSGTATAT